MSWAEFRQLLCGLDAETPLGRIVSIRAEKDPKRLKEFTPEMRRIRSEWLRKRAKVMPKKDVSDAIEGFRQMFLQMAGPRSPVTNENKPEEA